jgi:hypothetical protein
MELEETDVELEKRLQMALRRTDGKEKKQKEILQWKDEQPLFEQQVLILQFLEYLKKVLLIRKKVSNLIRDVQFQVVCKHINLLRVAP